MKTQYIDPVSKEILDKIPQRVKGEVDRSFEIAMAIDRLLKKKGLSKGDLANKTGKCPSEISQWLTGTQNFTLRTIALIEEALETKLISVNNDIEDSLKDSNVIILRYSVPHSLGADTVYHVQVGRNYYGTQRNGREY